MTNRKMVDRVITSYAGGLPSTDIRLRRRWVYNKLITGRSLMLALDAERDKALSDFNFQTLVCAELIEVALSDCLCVPANKCTVFRTKHKLPKPIAGYNRQFLTEVRANDAHIFFSPTTLQRERFNVHAPLTGDKPRFYVENDFLYLTLRDNLLDDDGFSGKFISIRGIWDDPEAAASFPNGCEKEIKEAEFKSDKLEECEGFLDKEFPVDSKFIERMVHAALVEMRILQASPSDQTPNAREDG